MRKLPSVKITRQHLYIGAAAFIAMGIGFGYAQLTDKHPTETKSEAHEEEGHDEGKETKGRVVMDAARIKLADIELYPALVGALSAEVLAQGSVAAEPDAEAVLSARADGVVSGITLHVGDMVKAGDTIAMIESRDASSIASDRASGAAKATAARQAYEREKRLFDAGITPRQELEAAQANMAQAEAEARRASAAAAAVRVSADGRQLMVVSPISGKLTVARAVLGTYVTAGTELFRVVDSVKINILAAVPASDAQRIFVGDAAVVETPTGAVKATVHSVTPGVDLRSRAASVTLELTGDKTLLSPGQAVRVRITPKISGPVTNRIAVPEEAVQSVEGQDVVFVKIKEGFQAVRVTVGARSAGRAEVISGLAPGQSIAGRGAFLLKGELNKGEAEHGH